jgi:hypothetical protein
LLGRNVVGEVCIDKLRLFTSFCINQLHVLGVDKREYYYLWRYVLIELASLAESCNIMRNVREMCKNVDVDRVAEARQKLLLAQYSAVSNNELLDMLAELCRCLSLNLSVFLSAQSQ